MILIELLAPLFVPVSWPLELLSDCSCVFVVEPPKPALTLPVGSAPKNPTESETSHEFVTEVEEPLVCWTELEFVRLVAWF